MIREDKLDIYNNSAIIFDKKTPKKIVSWITILIMLFVIIIVFSFIPFNVYKPYIGYVDIVEDEVNFVVNLEYSDFPILKNKKLYIKGKRYDYEVISVNENLILKINLEDDLKIQNNMIMANILEDRTTLIKILGKKLKKGFGL